MYAFIVNPNSRSGLGLKIWEQLELILKRKDISIIRFISPDVRDTVPSLLRKSVTPMLTRWSFLAEMALSAKLLTEFVISQS